MSKKENTLNFLSIIIGVGITIAAIIGIFYSNGGVGFTTVNAYGDAIELYGDGIYAFNSVLSVSTRLGSDATGIIIAIILIAFTLLKRRPLYAEVIRTSALIYLTYHSIFLVFGISMNILYFLYVICFGISLFVTIATVQNLLKSIEVPTALKKKNLTGTGVFLIIVGIIIALLWISSIIPLMLNNTYGSSLGIQTTEITYGIDLSITCPLFIMCGIWILRKKDIGFKVAPLLLNMLVGVAILVIIQRAFCIKMGIAIPVEALIGFIISFVIMGIISLYLVIKLLRQLLNSKEDIDG